MSTVEMEPATLRRAAGQGRELHSGTSTAIDLLRARHQGVKAEAQGFGFAAELTAVQHSWADRLGDVRAECGKVAELLKTSADDFERTDESTAISLKSLSTGGGDGAHTTAPARAGTPVTPATGAMGGSAIAHDRQWTAREMQGAEPASMPTADPADQVSTMPTPASPGANPFG